MSNFNTLFYNFKLLISHSKIWIIFDIYFVYDLINFQFVILYFIRFSSKYTYKLSVLPEIVSHVIVGYLRTSSVWHVGGFWVPNDSLVFFFFGGACSCKAPQHVKTSTTATRERAPPRVRVVFIDGFVASVGNPNDFEVVKKKEPLVYWEGGMRIQRYRWRNSFPGHREWYENFCTCFVKRYRGFCQDLMHGEDHKQ